jgi:hypothetical protein
VKVLQSGPQAPTAPPDCENAGPKILELCDYSVKNSLEGYTGVGCVACVQTSHSHYALDTSGSIANVGVLVWVHSRFSGFMHVSFPLVEQNDETHSPNPIFMQYIITLVEQATWLINRVCRVKIQPISARRKRTQIFTIAAWFVATDTMHSMR